MTIDVRPASAVRRASWTATSDSESRWAVASSSTTMSGALSSRRAIAIRCFSPPESRYPRSPTTVSSPSGSVRTNGRIWAASSASMSSASDASGRAYARFARIVSWKRCASWVTTPIISRSESKVASRVSIPLIRTAPERTS